MKVLVGLSAGGGSDAKWSDAGCSLKTDATGRAYRLDVSVREKETNQGSKWAKALSTGTL